MSQSKSPRKAVLTLCCCAMSVALAFATSFLKIHFLWGGSVTFFSMFFICFAGSVYGPGIGLLTAFTYSVLQFVQDPYILTPFQVCCDYLFAFTALGVSGFFHKNRNGLLIGYLVGVFLRGAFHSLGGYLYWMEYMPDNFPKSLEAIYPIVYNYSYLLIEALATVIIISLPPVRKALAYVKNILLGKSAE